MVKWTGPLFLGVWAKVVGYTSSKIVPGEGGFPRQAQADWIMSAYEQMN